MMTDLVKQAMFRVNQGGVSNLDTLDLVQVPLSLIDTNDANFYSVKEIQDLKDSIALIGLKQPLVVLPTDGRYRLIAGHRRYQALSELGKETAPCVIQNGLTETEEQLALILTNSTARELSYLEKLEQAKRLKELFMKRREEGAELPGRIRNMVAEAMNESASNLARMEKIDKHLIVDWKEPLNQGQISASTAYEIAKLPENMQQRLKEEYPVAGVLTAKVVQGAEKMIEFPFAPLNCPLRHGALCTRYAERAEMVANGTCSGCCKDCDHTEGCSAFCDLCKKDADREKERAHKTQEEMEAEEQYQKSAYRRAQLSLKQWAKDTRFDSMAEWNALPYTVKFFREMVTPSRNSWAPNLGDLFEMADLLEISLPELLGFVPELPPCTSEWHKYPTDKPHEGETVLCSYKYGQHEFDTLTYQNNQFGIVADNEFMPLKLDVKYWTRAFPDT